MTDTAQRAELNRAIAKCSRALGRTSISAREYDAWAKEHNAPRIWRLWRDGSTWAQRTREAGCTPRQEWRTEQDEAFQAVRAVAELLGRGPFASEYNEMRHRVNPTAPTAASIVRRFGLGWPAVNAEALAGSGLEYSKRHSRRAPRRRSRVGQTTATRRVSRRAETRR